MNKQFEIVRDCLEELQATSQDGKYIERAKQALAALDEIKERTQWRPIDTAPNGEPDIGGSCGWRGCSEWFIGLHKSRRMEVIKRLPENHTYGFSLYDETYYASTSFTHWMPLPEPPRAEIPPASANHCTPSLSSQADPSDAKERGSLSTQELIEWLDDDIHDFKQQLEEGYCHVEKVLRYTQAIRAKLIAAGKMAEMLQELLDNPEEKPDFDEAHEVLMAWKEIDK